MSATDNLDRYLQSRMIDDTLRTEDLLSEYSYRPDSTYGLDSTAFR